MKLNDKIRTLRLIKNYSQEYMAGELGIDTSSYCRIEKGYSSLSVERLEKIASLMNLSANDILLFGKNEISPAAKEKSQIHMEEEIKFLRNQLIQRDLQINQLLGSDMKSH